MTQKRFSHVLQEAADNPNPDGKVLSWLRRYLGISVHNSRRKRKWPLPHPSVIPLQEYYGIREEKIDDVLVLLMDKLRKQAISAPVTKEATKLVLIQVRAWIRRTYAERNKVEYVSNEELESFAPLVFNTASEEKVKYFESLYFHGVIDEVEYYLFFAVCHKESIVAAADRIGLEDATARQILGRTIVRLKAHIDDIDAGIIPKPRPTGQKRPTRTRKDEDILMNAICHIIGRAVPQKN